MDLFDSSRTMSFGGNYDVVVIKDYSHSTWTLFFSHKKDVFVFIQKLAKFIQKK